MGRLRFWVPNGTLFATIYRVELCRGHKSKISLLAKAPLGEIVHVNEYRIYIHEYNPKEKGAISWWRLILYNRNIV